MRYKETGKAVVRRGCTHIQDGATSRGKLKMLLAMPHGDSHYASPTR
jgi:hypothetical protein